MWWWCVGRNLLPSQNCTFEKFRIFLSKIDFSYKFCKCACKKFAGCAVYAKIACRNNIFFLSSFPPSVDRLRVNCSFAMTRLVVFLLFALFSEQRLVTSFCLAPWQAPRNCRSTVVVASSSSSSSSSTDNASSDSTAAAAAASRDGTKQQLIDLLEKVPRNAATSRQQTQEILATVRQLEPTCPTNPADILKGLAGVWELLWTAQDQAASGPLSTFRWINPLEDQAYSNNPGGRANPLLPLEIQNLLTKQGILTQDDDGDDKEPTTPAVGRTSTQTIDIQKGRVINIVSLPVRGLKTPASLTVRVDFEPYTPDPRRVNVKFQSFSVAAGNALKLDFPLGFIGPTGWLRTTYLDDDLRITRGHKGSVFVLRRPNRRASRGQEKD